MKRFKIGFLAVIAVLAMSFTIVSNEGMFDKTKLAPLAVGHCYTDVDLVGSITLDESLSCSEAEAKEGTCLTSQSGLTFVSSAANPEATGQACAGSGPIFCCAKLIIDTRNPSPCPSVTINELVPNTQNKYIVGEVYCKPEQP